MKDLQITQEFISFCHPDIAASIQRYLEVKEILAVQFQLPEIDIIRNEFGRCYAVGAHHACITLTNHLLERYCKLVLIAKDSGNLTISDLETIEDRFAPSIEKYMTKDLSATLAACKTQGIVAKEEYKILDKYRDIFRNGFGHAEAAKILQGAKGKFALGSFTDTSKLEMKELTYEKVPALQGIAIDMMAMANAWPYFVTVENFIRTSIRHYIKDVFDFKIHLIKPDKEN